MFENEETGSMLSLEVLERLRDKTTFVDVDDPTERGVIVMIPHDLMDHFPVDEVERLRDHGISIVHDVEPNKVLVVGAGYPALSMPALLSGWNENDVKQYDPIPDAPYSLGPTASKRGGNNKPWTDSALRRRRAKIAKKSRQKNRKTK